MRREKVWFWCIFGIGLMLGTALALCIMPKLSHDLSRDYYHRMHLQTVDRGADVP